MFDGIYTYIKKKKNQQTEQRVKERKIVSRLLFSAPEISEREPNTKKYTKLIKNNFIFTVWLGPFLRVVVYILCPARAVVAAGGCVFIWPCTGTQSVPDKKKNIRSNWPVRADLRAVTAAHQRQIGRASRHSVDL